MTPVVIVQGAGAAEPFSKPGLPISCWIEPLVTVRVTVVVWVMPPPTPETVIVEVPAAVAAATVIVIVEVPEPGAAIEVGLKATVTPVGWPVAESATALLKPFKAAVVIVTLPAVPAAMEVEAGEAEIVKSGFGVPPWAASPVTTRAKGWGPLGTLMARTVTV